MDGELRCVFVAGGETEAQQVIAFLEGAGIRAVVRGETLRHTHGLTIGGQGAVEVCVAASDADEATMLLESAEQGRLQIEGEG